MAFFAPCVQFYIFGLVTPVHLSHFKPCIVAACATHFKGFIHRGLCEASVFVIPKLEVVRNPPGGSLVPLDGKNVMVVPDFYLITLFPTPSPISPHHRISDLFRGILCVY